MKSIYEPRYAKLIEQLISTRVSLGITQTDLAKTLGRNQSFIAKVENFDRRIDVVELADWLHALAISPSQFMTRLAWWE